MTEGEYVQMLARLEERVAELERLDKQLPMPKRNREVTLLRLEHSRLLLQVASSGA